MILLMIFFFPLFVLVAVVATIICVRAWNKPVTFMKETTEPREARAIIGWGIAGMLLLPISTNAIDFGTAEARAMFPLAGYVIGVLVSGAAIFDGKRRDEIEAVRMAAFRHVPKPPSPLPSPKAPDMSKWEFASWDDEDAR